MFKVFVVTIKKIDFFVKIEILKKGIVCNTLAEVL